MNKEKFKKINLPLLALRVLHEKGYGRLRIYAYVREGLATWRAGYYPKNTKTGMEGACENRLFFNFVRDLYFDNKPWDIYSPEKLAEHILKNYSKSIEPAKGKDRKYTAWLDNVISQISDNKYFCGSFSF